MKPKLKPLIVASVVCAAVAVLLLFALHRDAVIDVPDDDPDMVAAIAAAQASLPEFWRVYDDRDGESDFSLNVRIADAGGAEHFWVTDIERRDGKVFGTIHNDPHRVTTVKLGDRIEIEESAISDWLYMLNGKIVGNYTLRPLFKKMPKNQVEQYKSMLAVP